MLSKKLMQDVIAYCSCYGNDSKPCGYVEECEFIAECHDIMNTYGCRPFEMSQAEKRDSNNGS